MVPLVKSKYQKSLVFVWRCESALDDVSRRVWHLVHCLHISVQLYEIRGQGNYLPAGSKEPKNARSFSVAVPRASDPQFGFRIKRFVFEPFRLAVLLFRPTGL